MGCGRLQANDRLETSHKQIEGFSHMSFIAQLLRLHYVHSIHYFIVLENTAGIETVKQLIPLCSLEISLPIGIRHSSLI